MEPYIIYIYLYLMSSKSGNTTVSCRATLPVCYANLFQHIRAPCLSHIMREKSHHPHGTAAIQKVTSGSGKSHQGKRITMAQPVSSIIRNLVTQPLSTSTRHDNDPNQWQIATPYHHRQTMELQLAIFQAHVLRIYANLSSIQSFRKHEICQHHFGLWHNATWAFKLTLAT